MGTKMLLQRTYSSPADRLFHACCIVEDRFWIYGGLLASQTSKYLNDIWAYSIDQETWNKVELEPAGERKTFRPHPLAYHSMTPVFSHRVLSTPEGTAPGTMKPLSVSRFEKLNV